MAARVRSRSRSRERFDPPGEYNQWRGFRFTLNNPVHDDLWYREELARHDAVQFWCFQHELAPTTGTPHLQGYVYLTGRGMTKPAVISARLLGEEERPNYGVGKVAC